MTASRRWDAAQIVQIVRDSVVGVAGLAWGDYLIHQPAGTTEPWAWVMAAAAINLPLVSWADRRLSAQRSGDREPSANGTGDREPTTP